MRMAGREISGKWAAIAAGVAVLVVAGLFWRFGRGLEDAGEASRTRVAIDAESGRVFEDYKIKDGDTLPWKNPATGNRTLYPAEKCFWGQDGSFLAKPTYVLLNEYANKPGPTLCPDCGRVVVAHNPLPPFPGEADDSNRRGEQPERREPGDR